MNLYHLSVWAHDDVGDKDVCVGLPKFDSTGEQEGKDPGLRSIKFWALLFSPSTTESYQAWQNTAGAFSIMPCWYAGQVSAKFCKPLCRVNAAGQMLASPAQRSKRWSLLVISYIGLKLFAWPLLIGLGASDHLIFVVLQQPLDELTKIHSYTRADALWG